MKQNRHGFSLAEMLTTVAILAVLCAIAIPGIIAIRYNLEMRRLDDTAREIYMAAQNRLTALKAAGTAGAITTSEPKNTETGDCWLFDGDSGMSTLLPVGSVEGVTAGGHYAIYYNEKSGDVLEVYYSEETDCKEIGAQTLNANYGTSKSARKEKKIGFYSGNGSGAVDIVTLPTATIELLNSKDEEDQLKLKVSFGGELIQNARLLVTVANKNDPSQKHTLYDGQYYNDFLISGKQKIWVLDGIGEGEQFKKQFSQITPGSDIVVTAELSKASDDEATYKASTAQAVGNSLFAALEGTTASITSARHLQNLSAEFSGLETELVTDAVQMATIDCTFITDTRGNFTAIGDFLSTYDGQGNEIRNLTINGAGLLKSSNVSTLRNIRIFNPVVNGSAEDNVGVLIGSASYTVIENCQVYTDSQHSGSGIKAASSTNVGGLIGYAQDCTINKCSSSLPQISGGVNVGGLIGEQKNTAVRKSYAATGVRSKENWQEGKGLSGASSASQVGGLIGTGNDIVEDCYVSGNISKAGTAGGIVGYTSGTIQRCYSVMTIARELSVRGGIAGNGSATQTNSVFWSAGAGDDTSENGKTLEEIAKLRSNLGGNWSTKPKTTSYNETYCVMFYPYPAITGLAHYGDWPTEQIVGIKLLKEGADEATATPLQYILVQRGTKVTVDAVAMKSETEAAMSSVAVELAGDISGNGAANTAVIEDNLNVSYSTTNGHTSFTLDSTGMLKTGAFCVDLSVSDIRVRAVFIVFDARITLKPDTKSGDSGWKNGTSRYGLEDAVLGQLNLTPANNIGKFTAEIATGDIAPTLEDLKTAFSKIESVWSNLFSSKTLASKYSDTDLAEKWNLIDTANDPSIHENSAGVIDEADSRTKLDTATGILTIVGKNSGSAFVRAHWAVDESVYAECRVTMKGARALIKAVATETKNENVNDTAYPYRVSISPVPGEQPVIRFTPNLFNAPNDPNGKFSYTWKVYRTLPGAGQEEALIDANTKTFTKNGSSGGDWSVNKEFELKLDDNKKEASYRVVLEFAYENEHGENKQSSVDETNITVYRKASRGESEYSPIMVQEKRPYGTSARQNVSTVSVEQVNGAGTAYAGCNESTLTGYIDGTVNTQICWYVYTIGTLDGSAPTATGGEWVKLTGSTGRVHVFDVNHEERATVRWVQNDNDVINGSATGGSVIVTGLDADEFDSTFKFLLKAEAVDVISGDGAASAKTITASVMPQLRIDPPSKAKANSYGETFYKFTANRRDGETLNWNYIWSCEDTTNLDTAAQSGNTQSITTYRNNKNTYQIRLVDRDMTDNNSINTDGHPSENWTQGAYLPGYERIAMSPKGVDYMVTRSSLITLNYGPYTATATYESRRKSVAYPITSINQNLSTGTGNSKTDYFVVEKGRARQLQFSWAEFNHAWYATAKPTESNANAHATLNYVGALGKVWNSSSSSPLASSLDGRANSTAANEGTWTYDVVGNSFSRRVNGTNVTDDPLTLSWTLDDRSVSRITSSTTWVDCPATCTDVTHDHQYKETSYAWGFEYDEVRVTTTPVTESITYKLIGGGTSSYSRGAATVSTKEQYDDPQWNQCTNSCSLDHKTTTEENIEIEKTDWFGRVTKQTYNEIVTEYLLNGQPIAHIKRDVVSKYGHYEADVSVTYGNGDQSAQTFNTYKLYVVGLDVRSSNSIANDSNIVNEVNLTALTGTGSSQTLYADGYFPSVLRKSGVNPTVTWSVDENDIVELQGNTQVTVTGNTMPSITVTAKKFTTQNAFATVTCAYTVTDVDGKVHTYTKNIPVYVGNAAYTMEVHVAPCVKSDIPVLESLFTDKEVSNIWLNQKVDDDYILIEDRLFGADVMYLKVTAEGTSTHQQLDLRDYYANIYTDGYYISLDKATDLKYSADGKTIYVRMTVVQGHANTSATEVEFTAELGSADAVTETIDLYRAPTVVIKERSGGTVTDVTNRSWPIEWVADGTHDQKAAALAASVESKEYTAYASPVLRNVDGAAMDGIVWYLDSPSGYSVESYLDFEVKESGYASITFSRSNGIPLIPDFRVVLNAQSSMAYYNEGPGEEHVLPGVPQIGEPSKIGADGIRSGSANPILTTSGYAIVFLPETVD